VAVGGVSNVPELSVKKKRAKTFPVETDCDGTSQVTLAELEFCHV